jgi:general secretion pathway protein I
MTRARTGAGQAGFTLVESVVALFVFATAAAAVIELNAGSVRALQRIESSVHARIVADNQMALAIGDYEAPERGVASGEEAIAGRTWAWTRTVAPTTDPDMDRVDVVVRLAGEEQIAATLTGFRGLR